MFDVEEEATAKKDSNTPFGASRKAASHNDTRSVRESRATPNGTSPKPDVVRSRIFEAARLGMWALQSISPKAAAAAALTVSTMPQIKKVGSHARRIIASARQSDFISEGYKIQVYEWGHGPRKILLMHGWSSRAADMVKFIQPLADKGFAIVAFDAPAHGESSGWTSHMRIFSRAAEKILDQYGPFHSIVAHSVGCGAIVHALEEREQLQPTLVLMGAQCEPALSMTRMAEVLGLNDATVDLVVKRFEKMLGASLSDGSFTKTAKSRRARALFIHDQDDNVIPIKQGRDAANALPDSRFLETKGLGHYCVPKDPMVIRETVNFICAAGMPIAANSHL